MKCEFLAVVKMSGCVPQMILEVKASSDTAAKTILEKQLENFHGQVESIRFAHVLHWVHVDPPR